MKTIIAGGRDYWLKPEHYKFLIFLLPKGRGTGHNI